MNKTNKNKTNTKTDNCTICKKSLEHRVPKWDVFIKLLPLKAQRPMKKKDWKEPEVLEEKLGLYTDKVKKLRQQAQHLHRFKTEGVPALERGHRHGLPHLTKRLSTTNTHKKRKKQFSQVGISYTSGQASCWPT